MKFLTLVHYTDDQIKRLKLAEVLHDWGHLETWKELCVYQALMFKKDPKQAYDIGLLAADHLHGYIKTLSYNLIMIKRLDVTWSIIF